MTSYYDLVETPIGWMGMLASDSGLARTTLPRPTPVESLAFLGIEDSDAANQTQRFEGLKEKLAVYFDGGQVSFDDERVDVDEAPDFSRAAWAACRNIPYGETRTYGWLATQAGRAGAPRAAGQCMARNRLPIVVPCHRVIASDGSLRGFGKGTSMLDVKRWLLDLESATR